MSRTARPRLEEDKIKCVEIVRNVMPLVEKFDHVAHPTHGNVELHITDALVVMLASFFNPLADSLRTIEQLSQMSWVKGQLNVERVCRSTLSDAFERFEPEQLVPMIRQLVNQVPHLQNLPHDLQSICQRIIASDGSYLTLPCDVAWALIHTKSDKQKQAQCRLNLQLDIDSFTPADLSISGADDASEPAAFMGHLQEGVIYVVDRNFMHFGFLRAVREHQSDFVLRLRKSTRFEGWRAMPLCARDAEVGVIGDRVGILPGSKHCRTGPPPAEMLREVLVADGRGGDPLRILTSLLDVPAYVIAALYQQRWQIELFFRWLKVWAGMDHLISHSKKGIAMQFYVAMIACLLMHIRTGRKVNKYMIMLMGQVSQGLASFEQIVPLLDRIEREKEQERRRRAAKKLLKNP